MAMRLSTMPHAWSKSGAAQMRILSVQCHSSIRKLQTTNPRLLTRDEVQLKECLTVASNKLICFKTSKARLKGGPLSQSLRTSQGRELPQFLHSNSSRKHLPLLVLDTWRINSPQTLQCTRTFVTSSVILAPSTPAPSVSQEHTTTGFVLTDTAHGASTTAVDTGVGPGQSEIANSAAESTTNAPLLFPDFPTIRTAELTIQKLHEITGLPWWATITLTAVALRVILIMPLSVYALHNAEKLNRLQPEVAKISKRLKQEVSMAMHQFKWDEKKAKDEYIKNMKRLVRDLQIKNNCHPMKNTASFWLQFPLWISVSYSLRNMTSRALSGDLDRHDECKTLTDQGALWFQDLTSTDSTWILPGLMGFVTLFNIEMTQLKIGEETQYRKRLTLFLRCLALLFIPISSTMPSAMVFYWVNSGFLAAVQNMLHDYSPFRRLVGLGPSETESSSPVRALMNRAKSKYFNR